MKTTTKRTLTFVTLAVSTILALMAVAGMFAFPAVYAIGIMTMTMPFSVAGIIVSWRSFWTL